jgi:hypothetical protein
LSSNNKASHVFSFLLWEELGLLIIALFFIIALILVLMIVLLIIT